MLLQLTHETTYRYTPAVETAQHMAYVQPRAQASQSLLDYALHIQPQPAQVRHALDVYGNPRCFFAMQTPHEVLSVVAHSLVATHASDIVSSSLAWERVVERFRYQAATPYDAATEFVFASPFAPRHDGFAAYARPSFAPGAPLLSAAVDLMQRIHADFIFESRSTEINTPALQALAQRKGVCQDFAHIMVACLRSLGLAARYVSGYLLTHPRPGEAKLTGSDASHAWVSVYVPDLPEENRWVDLCPTNNRWGWHAPGEDYITVAIGRDFGDVSPLRGVIRGGANHLLRVGVTVQCVGDNAPLGSQASKLAGASQSQSQSQSEARF